MDYDKEIQAIAAVNMALKGLSDEERFRVIQWVANKYVQNTSTIKVAGPARVAPPAALLDTEAEEEQEEESDEKKPTFDTFAELLDASDAHKESERLLITAYWLQVIKGEATWKSYEINKTLKDTGKQIDRISNPIRSLSTTKPSLMVQVSRSSVKGSKVFKLTTEGIKKAERMLGQEQ